MKAWVKIEKPIMVEADLPLENQAPEDVIAYYNKMDKNNLIAWISADGACFGCIKNNRSIAVDFRSAATISLYEERPAKGPGGVGLRIFSAEGKIVADLFSAHHSPSSLQWLKDVQPQLAALFNLAERYEDLGYCC